jgi:hypothetical protein
MGQTGSGADGGEDSESALVGCREGERKGKGVDRMYCEIVH